MRLKAIVEYRIPRNNLTAFQRFPEELFDVIMAEVVAELFAHVELPTQDFLVRQTKMYESSIESRMCSSWEHTHEEGPPERIEHLHRRGMDQPR